MENTAEKMEYRNTAATVTRSSSLADRVKKALEAKGETIASLAAEINYSRPTLSRYLSGKYDSNALDLELKLRGWLARQKVEQDAQKAQAGRPKFFESRDAKAVLGEIGRAHV